MTSEAGRSVLVMPYGELTYNDHGQPYCHFCGVAWKSIGNHAWQAHGIRSKEYRAVTGLSTRHSLGSKSLSEHRSKLTADRIASDPAFAATSRANWERLILGRTNKKGPVRESQRRAIQRATQEYWSDGKKQPTPRPRRKVGAVQCAVCDLPFSGISYYTDGPNGRLFIIQNDRKTCSSNCEAIHRVVVGKSIWNEPSDAVTRVLANRAEAKRLHAKALPHGTRGKYDRGCRCEICREYMKSVRRRYKA